MGKKYQKWVQTTPGPSPPPGSSGPGGSSGNACQNSRYMYIPIACTICNLGVTRFIRTSHEDAISRD